MDWCEILSDEEQEIVNTVKKFLKEKVDPVSRILEQKELFPEALVADMGKIGLFRLTIPEEYDGIGGGTLVASLVARELAYSWPSLHLIWTANTSLAAFPIIYAGTEEQKRRFLPRLASGEILGCYALTEADSGSDAAAMKTRAEEKNGKWILNGAKMFITNPAHAKVAVVFAKTGNGKHDISAFLIEGYKDGLIYPGITVNIIPKVCLKSSHFCEIVFRDVALPRDALLGEKHKGFKIAMATLDGGRINIAAQALGNAAWVFDKTLEYVKTRKQFGRTLWENQVVQFAFAECTMKLKSAWHEVRRISLARERGEMINTEAAAVKLLATQIGFEVCTRLGQYFGALGITKELPILDRINTAYTTLIYEGASNIQTIIIARSL